MKNYILLAILAGVICSHDMYLKLDSFQLEPHAQSRILLFNGTFEQSENSIDRERMIDGSLVGNGQRSRVDTAQWTVEGGSTILNFTTGDQGTWIAGVSTHSRLIEMDAETFNEYLEHDGVIDMLEWRYENNAADQPAVEKYSKHVKTIFQVGDQLSDDWNTILGYPIEFVPQGNPYDLHPGHALQFELLFQGKPLPNQLVYVGSAHGQHDHEQDSNASHSHDNPESGDHHHNMEAFRTDANGRFSINIAHEGVYYLRTIHLVASEEEGLTHESNWATLSFEIGEGHSPDHLATHSHEDTDDPLGQIPGYLYGIGSLILIFFLFVMFNRRSREKE